MVVANAPGLILSRQGRGVEVSQTGDEGITPAQERCCGVSLGHDDGIAQVRGNRGEIQTAASANRRALAGFRSALRSSLQHRRGQHHRRSSHATLDQPAAAQAARHDLGERLATTGRGENAWTILFVFADCHLVLLQLRAQRGCRCQNSGCPTRAGGTPPVSLGTAIRTMVNGWSRRIKALLFDVTWHGH